MTPRDTIQIYDPAKKSNGSGGFAVDTTKKGTLVISGLAQVTELKPTREQLAEQAVFGQTLKVQLWARKGVTLATNQVLYWKDKAYTLQGPPIENALCTEWTLYAKSNVK